MGTKRGGAHLLFSTVTSSSPSPARCDITSSGLLRLQQCILYALEPTFRGERGAADRVDLKRLLLADSLVRIGARLYMTFTSLYILNILGRGYVEWGTLQSVVAITSISIYIPTAKLADRSGRASRRPFITATFLFFSAFPFALLLAPSTAWLIPVFILSGLREAGEPARKALIMDLAAQSALGRQIGAYHMIRGILMSMAPLLGGVLWGWDPRSPFILGGATARHFAPAARNGAAWGRRGSYTCQKRA